MTALPTLDVIIPFHGRTDLLRRCTGVLAIGAVRLAKLLLVDDGSPRPPSPEVVRAIEQLGLPVQWLKISKRCGFVGAVNHAWTRCQADAVLLLNNDTIITDDTLLKISEALALDPDLGAVAPCSDNPADLFQYRACESRLGLTEARYLTAACLAVRRAAVRTPWFFDPVYSPGYFEDLDLSCRLRADGWKMAILETCRMHHGGSQTFRHDPLRQKYIARNRATFSGRWGGLNDHGVLEQLMFDGCFAA